MTIGKPAKILLSGSSGMLGAAIGKALAQNGGGILRLVRRSAGNPARSLSELRWNPPARQLDAPPLEGLSAAIHLSGANVATQRWTAAYKREIEESRIGTTQLLANTLARLKNPPAVLICASAVGFYGNRGDEILDESSSPGHGYFPGLCVAWENAARPAQEAGIRVVHLRFGMVVGPDGGAMAKLAPMFRLGVGGRLGSGKQWMSWVSETDAVAAALFALENPAITGPINVTAPQPVTNAEFTRELGHAVHRPTIMTAPAFALRLAFGEMADEALLSSTRAVPQRLLQAGFVFAHPTIASAFAAALTR